MPPPIGIFSLASCRSPLSSALDRHSYLSEHRHLNLPPPVAHAWRTWQATSLPTDNFRAANARALTYGIECDLDHQASYLPHLVNALAARNPHWDIGLRAGAELRDLEEFKERVERLELPAGEEAPLLFYIAATTELLRAILDAVANDGR